MSVKVAFVRENAAEGKKRLITRPRFTLCEKRCVSGSLVPKDHGASRNAALKLIVSLLYARGRMPEIISISHVADDGASSSVLFSVVSG